MDNNIIYFRNKNFKLGYSFDNLKKIYKFSVIDKNIINAYVIYIIEYEKITKIYLYECEKIIEYACKHGHVLMLKWYVALNLNLKFTIDIDAIIYAFENKHYNVVIWFLNNHFNKWYDLNLEKNYHNFLLYALDSENMNIIRKIQKHKQNLCIMDADFYFQFNYMLKNNYKTKNKKFLNDFIKSSEYILTYYDSFESIIVNNYCYFLRWILNNSNKIIFNTIIEIILNYIKHIDILQCYIGIYNSNVKCKKVHKTLKKIVKIINFKLKNNYMKGYNKN
jgi:hypothetical protein